MTGTDHIGFTVPDLDEAERFFVDILGAVHVYTLGPKRADDDFMAMQLGVHPRTEISEIRFYRLGNGGNVELFQYESADGQAPQPRNSDIGGHHLALYVDDLDAAAAYLRANDVEVMGDPVRSAGESAGQRWLYFRSPWGMQFELVSYPDGKAYERHAETTLWHPSRPAE
ncbi:VOC family protein [Microbacterium sp. NPDC058021]|uniref:VOC family protein n=1 Tax=Microbacterium sp. NPDC058021 TaxID=3346306 RepID=UPI0036DA52F1